MKKLAIYGLVLIAWSHIVFAQETFSGAPDKEAGEFVKLNDRLDDPNRGLCIDIPGHLTNTDIHAPLVVHTCKDGFWNYDGRFLPASLEKSNSLMMPKFKRCVTAQKMSQGAQLILAECDADNIHQDWELIAGQLRLKGTPELCIEVNAKPSGVSIGTRNHPVRHLVRPISLEQCVKGGNKYQQWGFVAPSETPGIRYPDGRPGDW
jgi:hypothetical protein